MYVKNKQTGAVETMPHGPATDAVTAGTHEFVNGPSDDVPKEALAANAVPLAEARKKVTLAEATLKGAKNDTDKAKAEIELKAARDELAKLEG